MEPLKAVKNPTVKRFFLYLVVILKLPFTIAPIIYAALRYVFKTACSSCWSEPMRSVQIDAAKRQFDRALRKNRERS
jgi:hypothetical protein